MTPEVAAKLGLLINAQESIVAVRPQAQPAAQAKVFQVYCRLGVYNSNTTDEELKQFFNVTMVAAQGADRLPGDSVLRVFLDAPRRYAFIHFRSYEEAEQALELDGIIFRGERLKLARPNNPDGTPTMAPPGMRPVRVKPLNLGNLNIVKTHVMDGPNKIFIGGLPHSLADNQVRQLMETYGPLKGFYMIKDNNTGQNKGYAFAEYRDPKVTPAAIKGLNGIRIGNRTIHVQLHEPTGGQGAAPPNLADLGLTNVPVVNTTKVLCLLRMVTEEDLQDDAEYEEILQDIKDECGNHGPVRDIVIPRTGQAGVGKVFVAFAEQAGAEKAKGALEGRKFMGRTVLVTFYDEARFDKREF